MDRHVKTYSYAYDNKTDIVFLKAFSATFRKINSPDIFTVQEDEWTIHECADELLFNKIDLDIIPDEIIREVGYFLLGGQPPKRSKSLRPKEV